MKSLGSIIEVTGVDVHEHLDRDDIVPVHSGLQVQGDVAVVPVRRSAKAGVVVPAEGMAVVRGENGGHTHLLVGEGLRWAAVEARAGGLDLGVLAVPDGGTGYLAHPEHGYLAMGPGAYVVRRQREQADEIRLVAD